MKKAKTCPKCGYSHPAGPCPKGGAMRPMAPPFTKKAKRGKKP